MSGVNIMNLIIGFIWILVLNQTNKREIIYCACNGRIPSFLNNPRQEIPLPEFVMALIILF